VIYSVPVHVDAALHNEPFDAQLKTVVIGQGRIGGHHGFGAVQGALRRC